MWQPAVGNAEEVCNLHQPFWGHLFFSASHAYPQYYLAVWCAAISSKSWMHETVFWDFQLYWNEGVGLYRSLSFCYKTGKIQIATSAIPTISILPSRMARPRRWTLGCNMNMDILIGIFVKVVIKSLANTLTLIKLHHIFHSAITYLCSVSHTLEVCKLERYLTLLQQSVRAIYMVCNFLIFIYRLKISTIFTDYFKFHPSYIHFGSNTVMTPVSICQIVQACIIQLIWS